MNFEEARRVLLNMLKSQGKAKNSEMIQALGGDVALFDLVREDLIFNDLAEDKKNVGLIYLGDAKKEENNAPPPPAPSRQISRETAESPKKDMGVKEPPKRELPPREVPSRNRVGARSESGGDLGTREPPSREAPSRDPFGRDPARSGVGQRDALRRETQPPQRESTGRELPDRGAAGKMPLPIKWDPFKGSFTDEKGAPIREADFPWNMEQPRSSGEMLLQSVHICFDQSDPVSQKLASRLERDLTLKGLRVWLESREMAKGDTLLSLLTSQSLKKPDGVILDVLLKAQCEGVRIIPLMVSPCLLPLTMYRLGWIDFQNWVDGGVYQQSLETLCDALINNREVPGIFQPLFEKLKPFDFGAQLSCMVQGFAGREWLIERLNAWLNGEQSRVFCVTGNLGAGKSAMLTHLISKYPGVGAYHVCKENWVDTLIPHRFICSLAAQLATQFENYRSALEAQNLLRMNQNQDIDPMLAEVDADSLLRILIGEPLRFEHPERPLLLVVDDLDEALLKPTGNGKNIVRLLRDGLRDLPSWVRLVYSAQRSADILTYFEGYNPEVGDLSQVENYDDINIYLEDRLHQYPIVDMLTQKNTEEAKIASLVMKKSNGNFFHVQQMLRAIEDGQLDVARPETFPEGIHPLLFGFFEHTFTHQEYDTIRSLIEVVLAAREPLTAKQISFYLDANGTDIDEALTKAEKIVPNWNGTYCIVHPLISAWLIGTLGAVHSFRINPTVGHRKIAGKLLDLNRSGKRDRYLLNYLVYHLIGAQNYTELYKVITSYGYIQGKCAAGLSRELVNDYSTVIELFEKLDGEQYELQAQWLKIIQSALRLSLRQIILDKNQLAGQLVGRLIAFEKVNKLDKLAKTFLDEIRARRDVPAWLCPQLPTLMTPGGALMQTMSGHAGKITAVLLSPDGRYIISASEDCTVRMWDLERGTELHVFRTHAKKVNAIAVTPDGQRLITASQDRLLKVWDMQAGKELGTLHGHTSYVNAVVATPDGRRVVSASSDNTLRVWDIFSPFTAVTGTEAWRELKVLKGHTDNVEKVIVTPDGRRAISASADKTIRVWDLESGEQIHVLRGHQSIITLLSVLPDGRRLVSSSIEDYSLKVWDIESGKLLYSLRGHTNFISGFAATQDSHMAITASGDRTLKEWMLPPMLISGQDVGGIEIHTLRSHNSYVRAVSVVTDQMWVISGSADKTIKIWDMQTGRLLRTLLGHSEGVNTVIVTPDNRRIVSASLDNTIKVWDISAGVDFGLDNDAQVYLTSGHTDIVNAILITPDGRRAVSASNNGMVKVWNISVAYSAGGAMLYLPGAEEQIGREMGVYVEQNAEINAIALTPDGRRVVSAGKGIKVLALESCTELQTYDLSEWTYAVAVTPDGKWVVSGSGEHTLKVWDLESGRYLGAFGRYQERASWVRALAVTPDGRRVLSGATDKMIKMWDLRTGKEIGMLRGHTDKVNALVVTPDGRAAISASEDGSIKIWDVETSREVRTLREHQASVRSISIAPDGKRLISASDDQTIKVWNLVNGQVLANFVADGKISACAFSTDGYTILAGGASGRVHFLRLIENPAFPRP